jgi:hypothetical protein
VLLQAAKYVWVPLLVVLMLVAVVVWLALRFDIGATARISVLLVAIAGGLTSAWRVIGPKLRSIEGFLTDPVIQAALDSVVADAITLPPVGVGDPSGWSRFLESAEK